jgi:tRNA(fMet)-specific endonuclease VapC
VPSAIVTIHEQFLGSHTYINRARNSEQLVRGYEFMTKLVRDLKIIPVVRFDEKAAAIFDRLQSQRIKLGTMDLRIAAIALAHGLVLLTRNHRDFIKVPELVTEDWTQP